MEFLTDNIERIKILSSRLSDRLIASSEFSILPETKSVLITLNKLNRNLKSIDLNLANPVTSSQMMQRIIKYFEISLNESAEHQSTSSNDEPEETTIILQSRLEHLLESFDSVIYFDKNDLFSLSPDHERWKRLKAVTKVHNTNPEEIENDLRFIMKKLLIGQASFVDAYSKPGLMSNLTVATSALYYFLFQDSAFKKMELIHARPQLELIKYLFNVPETNLIRLSLNFLISYVSINEQFFIPRVASHIFEPFRYRDIDSAIQYTQADNVSVRFLSNDHRFYNALIIHIHGGGFISMSSRSHQCYTRKWVRSLNIPCLSIDYRLSPEFPFPAALDDVWQVYNWVLKFAESQLNVRPDRIFLAGDSAGANIALSLTYRIIEENLKAPSGVMLAYPALNLSDKQFSFSMMDSIEDKLISLSFLKSCSRAYVPPQFSQNNYFISLINAPVRILERLPPVRIATGDKDPFHDDCWRLTEKIIEAGGNAELSIFKGLIHGALNFCYRGGVRGSQAMVDEFEKWMQDLLYSSKEHQIKDN